MRKQMHTFSLDPNVKQKLQDMSKRTNISMSQLVERAIEKLYREMKEDEQ